ncbi:hypothetical protein Y032_0491g2399 [Ancylostoma ceylanicum]|uniref:DnaJ homolog subfamily C member 21 n=1 Tax=Ancylostoma ceylanicum TaxID=53326 RepID=A0A016WW85_9BILA|nr:hypothetical protein Y032_0491g2399 [Ancylostoma ceylanicum]
MVWGGISDLDKAKLVFVRKGVEIYVELHLKQILEYGFEKYHRGGFEPKMTRREAAMILGLPATAKPNRIKEAHKRIMIANHPDRGGSPYLAAKINEAKDLLESSKS